MWNLRCRGTGARPTLHAGEPRRQRAERGLCAARTLVPLEPLAYRFTDLGWFQFERVCMELMELRGGIAARDWKRHADGLRSVFVERDVTNPSTGEVIPGPVCVIVSWWRPRTANRRVHFERVKRQAALVPYHYGQGPMR